MDVPPVNLGMSESTYVAPPTDEERATDALAAFTIAVGGGRMAWGKDDNVDVVIVFRNDPPDAVIFAVDVNGIEYDVKLTRRD